MRAWTAMVGLAWVACVGCAGNKAPMEGEVPGVGLSAAGGGEVDGGEPVDPVAAEIDRLAQAYRDLALNADPASQGATGDVTDAALVHGPPVPALTDVHVGVAGEGEARVEAVLGSPEPQEGAVEGGPPEPSPEPPSVPIAAPSLDEQLRLVGARLAELESPTARDALLRGVLDAVTGTEAAAALPETLTGDERQLVEAAVSLVRSLVGESPSAAEGAGVLRRVTEMLESGQPMRISRVELCTSVAGFGQYEPFDANRFRGGRAQKVIVYTELERIAQKAESVGASPQHETDLTHTLILSKDGVQQKSWASERLTGRSRNPRRDFFVVRMVELPDNLSIGTYDLKVIVEDNLGGSRAESVVQLSVTVER